ncbi:hypothetical protein D7Y11_08680 [Corallococcus sp. AB018]|uniref:hypothetical protein n=1 Tax=unclassified Corallococcus TaxID=2685029 RepID=UPI000EA40975|nr:MULTISPECIES: hypothetical protein [unclassified Corallococcus]RKH27753.1 hypothetical protein D7V77_10685 [Corallococcus sp. CA041A]RUO93608.1 hypothetical protein D7Y11_08680 [Corallococcus sp. AB018]
MEENLGEKIYEASCFINDIYQQVQILLLACDAAFDRAGLVPANGNEVELHRARNLYAVEAWSQRAVGRVYVPRQPDGKGLKAFVAVEVHLRPRSATHALLVLAYAEASGEATPQALTRQYRDGEWLEDLLVQPSPGPNEWRGGRAEHPRHLPLADELKLKSWPLTDITDESALEHHLISRLREWASPQSR